jgi:hypothetical protein
VAAAISVFQLKVFHHPNTDHQENKRISFQTACLVFSYCFKHVHKKLTHF